MTDADATTADFDAQKRVRLGFLTACLARYDARFDALGREAHGTRNIPNALERTQALLRLQREAAALRREVWPLEDERETLEQLQALAEHPATA